MPAVGGESHHHAKKSLDIPRAGKVPSLVSVQRDKHDGSFARTYSDVLSRWMHGKCGESDERSIQEDSGGPLVLPLKRPGAYPIPCRGQEPLPVRCERYVIDSLSLALDPRDASSEGPDTNVVGVGGDQPGLVRMKSQGIGEESIGPFERQGLGPLWCSEVPESHRHNPVHHSMGRQPDPGRIEANVLETSSFKASKRLRRLPEARPDLYRAGLVPGSDPLAIRVNRDFDNLACVLTEP